MANVFTDLALCLDRCLEVMFWQAGAREHTVLQLYELLICALDSSTLSFACARRRRTAHDLSLLTIVNVSISGLSF